MQCCHLAYVANLYMHMYICLAIYFSVNFMLILHRSEQDIAQLTLDSVPEKTLPLNVVVS